MENGDNNWDQQILEDNTELWDIVNHDAYSGTYCWLVEDTEVASDIALLFEEPILITGNQPVMRFFHKYDTEAGSDGGLIQISADGGFSWENVDHLLFKNGYRGALAYTTFAVPDLQAYWGDSEGYIDTYLDLSDFIGQEINIRFRFGTDEEAEGTTEEGIGWFIDDVEIFDMFNYMTEACITSAEGDLVCSTPEHRGTIVQSEDVTAVINPEDLFTNVEVYPNPAHNLLNINITLETKKELHIQLLNIDGKIIKQKSVKGFRGEQLIPLSVTDVPEGFYVIRLNSDEGTVARKVVVR